MRLTEENYCGYGIKDRKDFNGYNDLADIEKLFQCLQKLGQLEDILEGHNIETLKELDGLLWYVKEIKKIEEKLGIDLITLFKALEHFWTFNHGKKVCIHYPFLRKNENCKKYELVFNQQAFGDTGIRDAHIFYYSVWLKDYGKTWALTKEELK